MTVKPFDHGYHRSELSRVMAVIFQAIVVINWLVLCGCSGTSIQTNGYLVEFDLRNGTSLDMPVPKEEMKTLIFRTLQNDVGLVDSSSSVLDVSWIDFWRVDYESVSSFIKPELLVPDIFTPDRSDDSTRILKNRGRENGKMVENQWEKLKRKKSELMKTLNLGETELKEKLIKKSDPEINGRTDADVWDLSRELELLISLKSSDFERKKRDLISELYQMGVTRHIKRGVKRRSDRGDDFDDQLLLRKLKHKKTELMNALNLGETELKEKLNRKSEPELIIGQMETAVWDLSRELKLLISLHSSSQQRKIRQLSIDRHLVEATRNLRMAVKQNADRDEIRDLYRLSLLRKLTQMQKLHSSIEDRELDLICLDLRKLALMMEVELVMEVKLKELEVVKELVIKGSTPPDVRMKSLLEEFGKIPLIEHRLKSTKQEIIEVKRSLHDSISVPDNNQYTSHSQGQVQVRGWGGQYWTRPCSLPVECDSHPTNSPDATLFVVGLRYWSYRCSERDLNEVPDGIVKQLSKDTLYMDFEIKAINSSGQISPINNAHTLRLFSDYFHSKLRSRLSTSLREKSS